MNKIFRKSIGYIIALPFFVFINLSSVFISREKSIEFWGSIATKYIQFLAEITLIPKIKNHTEFDEFKRKLRRKIYNMKLIYDISVPYEDNNRIVLNYKNCPHCEAFIKLGLREIAQLVCDSDWNIAEKNIDLWEFERHLQLSTGDNYCDHTYKRK